MTPGDRSAAMPPSEAAARRSARQRLVGCFALAALGVVLALLVVVGIRLALHVASPRSPAAGAAEAGTTPLVRAVRDGRSDEIRRLVAGGADPDEPDGHNGWPPLIHAVHVRDARAVAALLESGADPDRRAGGWTPLVMAAAYGDARLVELLLARGADPLADPDPDANPLLAAVVGSTDVDALTVGGCQTEAVRALREGAPELTLPDGFVGRTALAWMRLRGCDEIVRLLTEPPPEPRF